MHERIRDAFDGIHAEEALKQRTLARVRSGTLASPHRHGLPVRRVAVAFACVLLLVAVGAFGFNLYYAEAAYIDLDINPSVELCVNRFGRVIDTAAYNEDGERLLAAVSLRHEPYEQALQELVAAADRLGYLGADGLVSVSLSAAGNTEDAALLAGAQESVRVASAESETLVDVFWVDESTRATAHSHHLSPARYLAILELQELEPDVTVEECQGHSLQELRGRVEEHGHRGGQGNGQGNGHNNSQGNVQEDGSGSDDGQHAGQDNGQDRGPGAGYGQQDGQSNGQDSTPGAGYGQHNGQGNEPSGDQDTLQNSRQGADQGNGQGHHGARHS